MNMFRSRRKPKDLDGQDTQVVSQPAIPTPRAVKGLRRKHKNIQAEQKPIFDLSSALPDNDDFRTSLLMPNLSARFSMLREQDDPNSKIGKASDDSVLFPKRVSRLNLFGHHNLADINEVEPLSPAFRPPFADRERSNSVGDGYDSDSGSVMSRSRPGEGSTLFGGRQNKYRLPASLQRNFSETDTSTAGSERSAFGVKQSRSQTPKARDITVSPSKERDSIPATEEGDSSDIVSPATTFSKHRETQSSINSNTGRSSTAATSIASESIALRSSATENVYSKHHESVLPTPENLASISIPKTREEAIPNRFFSQSRSVTGDKTLRPSPVYGASLRNASSPPIIDQQLDFGFNIEPRSVSATIPSPTESSVPCVDDVLADSVQPNDRGKATALGLFNKPAREFNEHQFNQRQLQMHEDHVSTMSSGSRSTSRASNDVVAARQNSIQAVVGSRDMSNEHVAPPWSPSVPTELSSPVSDSTRGSKTSGRNETARPRSKSAASANAVSDIKSRVESLIRQQNAELIAFEAEKSVKVDFSENKENHVGAFFDNDDDDETDFEESSNLDSSRINSVQIDESHIHPAFRNSYRVSDIPSRKSNHSNFSQTRSVVNDERRDGPKLAVPIIETNQADVGLSGLIRTHLRQHSDKSSFMLRPESGIAVDTAERSSASSTVSVLKAADTVPREPFEFDLDETSKAHEKGSDISEEPQTPTAAMSQMAQHFLTQAMAIKNAAEKEKAENASDDFLSQPFQEDLEPKHQRSESSETTKERREFDEKLAQRRRKIQEGLKSVTERERPRSPTNFSRAQPVGLHAFVQQRAATDPQPKALKMLGLQPRYGVAGALEDERERHIASRGESRGPLPEHGFNSIRQTATYARFTESSSDRQHPPRSATPPASRQDRRERSNSSVADRSRSRPRRDINPPVPHALGTFHNWNQHTSNPTKESHSPDLVLGSKPIQRNRPHPQDLQLGANVRAAPKPSSTSPQSSQELPSDAARPLAGVSTNGRTTSNSFNRKRSVTKTMISEPKFVSSTSSVPLVHLPDAQQNQANSTPMVPMLPPRRRGNTITDKPIMSPPFSRSPLEPVPGSPVVADFGLETIGRKSPSPRKLRKATSEGGSIAAKARQQAIEEERMRSPALPVFPNRSTTAVDSRGDGSMF